MQTHDRGFVVVCSSADRDGSAVSHLLSGVQAQSLTLVRDMYLFPPPPWKKSFGRLGNKEGGDLTYQHQQAARVVAWKDGRSLVQETRLLGTRLSTK